MYIDKNLEKYNINGSQIPILIITSEHEGINQNSISKIFNIHRANITRSVKKLEQEGYIIRKKDKNDHRNYNLFLTKKAKEREPEFKKIFHNWIGIILTDFTEEEKKLFINFLQRASKNAVSIKQMDEYSQPESIL
jgi:DNA-binding MarR family transcriptional regulator